MKAPRNNSPIPNQPFSFNDLPTLKGPYWDVALGNGVSLSIDGNSVTAQGGGGGGSLPSQFPPYNCNTDVDTTGITIFDEAWMNCYSLTEFPLIDTSSGVNFYGAWSNCLSLTTFPLLDVSKGINFNYAWAGCSSLTSFPSLSASQGVRFEEAWSYCNNLTSFSQLDVSNGQFFGGAWRSCNNLTSFPAGMFNNCSTNYNYAFQDAWYDCALNQTSVNNILVSLDTSGIVNNYVNINGGTSAAPSGAGAAAKTSLQGKGWTVATN
jgi:hypothetical protein